MTTAITDRTAKGIAATVSRMVTDGSLPVGTRLPTVRLLADRLGVSPTTVSEAWQILGEAGVLAAYGRRGTYVTEGRSPLAPRRYRSVTEGTGQFPLDLSTGTPDPALLPDLSAALARVSASSLTTSYIDDPVLPALREVLLDRWPFPPETLTVVDGAMDALDRLAATMLRYGDRVIVEDPTFPPLLDLLEQMGVEVVGVAVDDEGIVPASLAAALLRPAVALFTQPRAHNPLGVSATPRRVAELAGLLAGNSTVVVEDDHAGDIAARPLATFGAHLPSRTILIRSFSKSHGPDLRAAAVGGAGDPITRMARRRVLGAGWTSRLLQAVLAELLADDAVATATAFARDTYAARRSALSSALADRGVSFTGTDGINLWVEVDDERAAQLSLASHRVGVAPGRPFNVAPPTVDHLRITVGLVADGVEALADHIAAAAHRSAVPHAAGR